MKSDISDPLDAIQSAASTVIGWTIAIAASTFLGFWLGLSVNRRGICSPSETIEAMTLLVVIWLFFPRMLVAYTVTFFALYLPIFSERTWLRWVALIVNLFTWLIIVGWFWDW